MPVSAPDVVKTTCLSVALVLALVLPVSTATAENSLARLHSAAPMPSETSELPVGSAPMPSPITTSPTIVTPGQTTRLVEAQSAIPTSSYITPPAVLKYEVGFQNIHFSWQQVLGAHHYRLQVNNNSDAVFTDVPGAENLQQTTYTARTRYWDTDWSNTAYRIQACRATAGECHVHAVARLRRADSILAVRRIRSRALISTSMVLYAGAGYRLIEELLALPHRNRKRWFMSAMRKKKAISKAFGLDERFTMEAISADRNTMVVGGILNYRYYKKNDTDPAKAGLAIYNRDGGRWRKQYIASPRQVEVEGVEQELSQGVYRDSVVISADGSTMAIGDPAWTGNPPVAYFDSPSDKYEVTGAVQIYYRRNGQWRRQAVLRAANAGHGDEFGIRVALSANGNTLAVSAPGEDSSTNTPTLRSDADDDTAYNAGAVYVFTRSGNRWRQHSRLKTRQPRAYDSMGTSLALSDDGATLATGIYFEEGLEARSQVNKYLPKEERVPLDPRLAGGVYVFTLSDDRWSQHDILKPDNNALWDYFGLSLSLSADGSVLAASAHQKDIIATNISMIDATSGIGTADGDSAANAAADATGVSATTNPSDPTKDDIATSKSNPTKYAGAAYVFARIDGRWQQKAYLTAPIPFEEGLFGTDVSISPDGDTLIVGVSEDHPEADTLAIDLIEPDSIQPWTKTIYIY